MNIALLALVAAATTIASPVQETPAVETTPKAPAPDPKSAEQATQLLKEVAEAYRKAPALTDAVSLHAVHPMGEQKQELTLAFGPNSSRLNTGSLEFTAVEGKLYATRPEQANKYFVTDLQGDMEQTLQQITGESRGMPAHFAMRAGLDQEQLLKRIALGLLENPVLNGVQETTDESGAKVQEIHMSDGAGSAKLLIDPATKLMRSLVVKGVPPGAPPSIEMTLTVKFDPRVHEAAERPIAFETGDRRAVDELSDLRLAEGDPAPDFTLTTADGKSVKLSDLRGNAVVLDFWATWCVPCRQALPHLEEFSKWAESSGQKVKVFAINTMERTENDDEAKAKATGYWTQKSFTMPLLLDLENEVAMKYEVQGLPTTFVIGPDGLITQVHPGFQPDMVETLKREVGETLTTK